MKLRFLNGRQPMRDAAVWCVSAAGLASVLLGCSTPGRMAKLATALAKDPATVNVTISSVYGTMKFVRTNPGTNSVVKVLPDGTVTVERK